MRQRRSVDAVTRWITYDHPRGPHERFRVLFMEEWLFRVAEFSGRRGTIERRTRVTVLWTTTRMPENRGNAKERERRGKGLECPRRLKGKYSAGRGHPTYRLAGRGISILKDSRRVGHDRAYSSSSTISTSTDASSFSSSSFYSSFSVLSFCLLLSLFFPLPLCALVQFFSQPPSPPPLSTSFLTYSFSQSAVSAAAAISLSDKSQVVRLPKRAKGSSTMRGRRRKPRGLHNRIVDVTMWTNRYARRTSKLRSLRKLYHRIVAHVDGLRRRTERFFATLACIFQSEAVDRLQN